jgi:hypothetical protein
MGASGGCSPVALPSAAETTLLDDLGAGGDPPIEPATDTGISVAAGSIVQVYDLARGRSSGLGRELGAGHY